MSDTKKPQSEGKIITGVTLVEIGPNGEQLYAWGDAPDQSLYLCGYNCASNVKVGDTGRLVYRSTASEGLYWFEKDRSLLERVRDAAIEADKQGGFVTPGLRAFFADRRQERCPFEKCDGEVLIFGLPGDLEMRERYQAVNLDDHLSDCLVASFERWQQSRDAAIKEGGK